MQLLQRGSRPAAQPHDGLELILVRYRRQASAGRAHPNRDEPAGLHLGRGEDARVHALVRTVVCSHQLAKQCNRVPHPIVLDCRSYVDADLSLLRWTRLAGLIGALQSEQHVVERPLLLGVRVHREPIVHQEVAIRLGAVRYEDFLAFANRTSRARLIPTAIEAPHRAGLVRRCVIGEVGQWDQGCQRARAPIQLIARPVAS